MIYNFDGFVGRSSSLLSYSSQKGISTRDAAIYEKLGQCLASLHGFLEEAQEREREDYEDLCFIQIPIIVVPDNKLWVVRYSDDGNVIGSPEKVSKAAMICGREFSLGERDAKWQYSASHVIFLTISEVIPFFQDHMTARSAWINHLRGVVDMDS